METVRVNRVQVYPCDYWGGLIRRAQDQRGPTTTGFDKSTWPTHSSAWCWQCCHPFDNVPAYYPIDLDIANGVFYFIGNFCSWNCVKGYAMRLNDHRRPEGASYISLLAFLTVHRPKFCLHEKEDKHPHTCPCIDMFHGIQLPAKKELLQTFGGTMPISEYRKDFMMIEDHDWVDDYFHKNNVIRREMESITATQRRRAYTFCFVSYPGPTEAVVDQLYVLPLTHKTLPKQKQNISEDEPPKKAVKPCKPTSTTTGRRRGPKSNAPAPTPVAAPAPAPTPIEPAVSEEQAFYVSSVQQFGNLFSSMGITIEKKA